MRILFLIILCIAASGNTILGQECQGTIQGYILDQEGESLPNAAVSLDGQRLRAIAHVDGSFKFTGLCAGTYQLLVTYIGYAPHSQEVTVPTDEVLSIRLAPSETIFSSRS